ncbi:MAG TPA: type II secretion system protein M [Gammaproteobacteria bacterium]|nr:type II secretion system protein M [Gammaproteobacteria bacterium]
MKNSINDKIIDALTQALAPANQWLSAQEERDRKIIIIGGIALIIMVFYLAIWEPINTRFEQQQSENESKRKLHSWMKGASAEIKALKSSGSNSISRTRNQSISSLADRSAATSGVKPFIEKIEQSKTGVKVVLKAANFDQIITWLNNLQSQYGIFAVKVKVEKSRTEGAVDANITLERPS